MAEKGRKPAMNIWAGGERYQGASSGISRGTLVVRQGALKSEAVWRPTRAPARPRGKATRANKATMPATAVAGRAAEEPCARATEFTHAKTAVNGAGKTRTAKRAFASQESPANCRNKRPDTKPPTGAVTAYRTIIAVNMAPRFVGTKNPAMAHDSNKKVTTKRCVPAPTKAARALAMGGNRKTSPLISFHPVSSSPSSSSSTSMYREKSFLRTRIMIIVRKAVNKRTKTKELIMESQWISNVPGKKRESWYRDILSVHFRSGRGTQSTE
mmetsp:Transcript_31116/g.100260  ORF Transcript_31116/g.100260 Transcript_31116/m.100260 type:complete len:270 (-) Transcript_31116:634-1443(-)